MILIPPSLQIPENRFILVNPNSKKPLEKRWNKDKNYPFDSPRLRSHLEKGGNCGILCGPSSQGIWVFDIDGPDLYECFKDIPTLTTNTPGRNGYHLFFISKMDVEYTNHIRGFPIDIIGRDHHAVIPPSIIDGKKYRVICDGEIMNRTPEKILKYLPSWDIPLFKLMVDAREIVSYYYPPHKRYSNHIKIECPFHFDRRPSMAIFENNYHCFGCGAHGDIITFVMNRLGIRFKEAIAEIERISGIECPKDKGGRFTSSVRRNNADYNLTRYVRNFLKRRCDKKRDGFTCKDKLLDEINNERRSQNRKNFSKNKLTRIMLEMGYKEIKPTINGVRVRAWKGIIMRGAL